MRALLDTYSPQQIALPYSRIMHDRHTYDSCVKFQLAVDCAEAS